MKVLFLLLMLLSSGVYGQGEYSLHPNLESQKFLYLAKGTQIIPLCNPYLPPSCFHQWVAKAQPLTLTSDETRRSMIQFYLPGLINLEERRVSNTEGDLTKKGWRRLEEISDDNIRYYQKLNSPRIREFRSEGNQSSVREGDLVYVSENDINVLEVSRTQEKTNSEQPSRKNQKKRDTISVKTKRTSYALEGELSKTKTLPEGCVVIDKQQEASSCMECNIRDLNIVKTDEQITKLKVLLEGVEKGYTGTFKGKKRKVAGSRRSIKGKKIVIEKICSPQESLRSIIENLNRSCTPNRFKTFFQELYLSIINI